jgi:CubicO group peptidase (beta-lactamase class C family)
LNALLLEHHGAVDTRTSLQAMFPGAAFAGLEAGAVTARDLLGHTSGLDNAPMVWATALSGVHDAASRERLVARSRAHADARHGTFRYTNLGYNILSVWLDRRIGSPWQRQLEENVFTPLGMTRTSASISEAHALGWPLAKPYSILGTDRDTPLYLEKADETMQAAGGMVSTAPDLARFLIAQLDAGRLDDAQALPAAVIERSHAPLAVTDGRYQDFKRSGYAWGWYTGGYKGRRMLHHFGSFAGFHAHLSFIPEANAGLVVLNNEDFLAAHLTNLIADHAYGVLLGEANVAASASPRVEAMLENAAQLDARIAAEHAKIESRTWNLSLPPAAYAGTYSDPDLGNMVVTLDSGGRLGFRWGRLHAQATGYDSKDHLRVEFVPNSGEVVRFVVDDGTPIAVEFDGLSFSRVAP